jgi:hypothetical protein
MLVIREMIASRQGKKLASSTMATTTGSATTTTSIIKVGTRGPTSRLLTVKFRQPSHEFTFGVGMNFIPYPLVLTPLL